MHYQLYKLPTEQGCGTRVEPLEEYHHHYYYYYNLPFCAFFSLITLRLRSFQYRRCSRNERVEMSI